MPHLVAECRRAGLSSGPCQVDDCVQVVDNQTIEPSTHRFKLCLYLYEEKKMKILELLTILAATFKTGNRQILKIQVLQL